MPKIKIPAEEIEFRKLHLMRNDVLVLKRPKEMDDWDWRNQLSKLGEELAQIVGYRVLIFGVDRKLSDISKISEEQMESYGWIRRDRVFATVDEAYEHVASKYEELAREYHASMTEEEE